MIMTVWKPQTVRRCCAAVLLSAILSPPSIAHDFWILPHDASGKTGDSVVFELRIGPGWPGKRTPRLQNLISTFNAVDPQGSRAVEGHDGALVIGHLKNRVPGANVVTLTTNGAQITLPANEFEDYLEEEGLSKIIAARRQTDDSKQPGVEIFTRYAKTLILVDSNSSGFDKVIGLERELVPRTDPLKYKPGAPFQVQLLSRKKTLSGIQVKAELNTTPPTVIKAVTDANGMVTFTLPEQGEWLFSAVDMLPADNPDADWHSLWASLTLPLKGQ